MPRRDGTGPLGQGAMTGRGMGTCNGTTNANYGQGLGLGRGRGLGLGRGQGLGLGRGYRCRRFNANSRYDVDSNRSLKQQKADLEARLNAINKQLGE